MKTYKYKSISSKIISSISIILITLIAVFLPSIITISVFSGSVLIITAYHIIQNFDIDYKYWFSFIGQLSGLILIVASFIMMLTIGFSWF
ncbi:MAG: hypothetical protein JKX98_00680 [Alcanivoracaceae bacterium]|nr:hypothetical protein [Alcanivoracaceae bacterium]